MDLIEIDAEDYRLGAEVRRLARRGKRVVEIARILKQSINRISRIAAMYEIATPERVGSYGIDPATPPIGFDNQNGIWGADPETKRLAIWERQREAARRLLNGEEA